MLILTDINEKRKLGMWGQTGLFPTHTEKIWIKEKPCRHVVMMSFPSAEQNDNIFQILPVDKSHHEDTA